MIEFKGLNEKGLEVIEVTDYYKGRSTTIEFRPIRDDELTYDYFDKVMNRMWLKYKNFRDYGAEGGPDDRDA